MIGYVNELFGGFTETREIKGNEVVYVANDKDSDYANIRDEVGIFPMTFTAYYLVTGDEAEEKLDYLLTKSIQHLNYGQNRICYFLGDNGEIAALVTIFKNDESFIIEAFNWNAQTVEGILSENGVPFKKEDYSCILLEGRRAIEFIQESLETSVDYFVYQSHYELECCGQEVTVARTGYTGEYGYKLIGPATQIRQIWTHILPAHKDRVSGYAAFELCQYEIKQPSWELPYLQLSGNVFEIDYHWFVDFKKDIDYVGKDSLYNTKPAESAKSLIGAISESPVEVGADIKFQGEIVGKAVDGKFSLGLQKYITMLFVDKEYAHANITFQTSNDAKLTTASAPYVFPASWRVGR